jgi:thymidylate synthase ThyX
MNEMSATVVLDSISDQGVRLTTMEVTCHRFILAELNTHRAPSRNSGSSRAVPVAKQLDRVRHHPAMPVSWPAECPGMQGGDELSDVDSAQAADLWIQARDNAVAIAESLVELGVHKSVVNRLLEPFSWHTVIISATEWDNFFAQRCSPLAQPEMREVALLMRSAYLDSRPDELAVGEWHTPYITDEDQSLSEEDRCRVSVARCARVSYLTHDGRRSVEKDLDLYRSLVGAVPMHASPLEHVATPAQTGETQVGNFRGWRQLRHIVEGGLPDPHSKAVVR